MTNTVPAIPEITSDVIDHIATRILRVKELQLSAVEVRIVKWLGQGLTLKQISQELGLKHPSDAHNRLRAICRKNSTTRQSLAVYGAFISMHTGEL